MPSPKPSISLPHAYSCLCENSVDEVSCFCKWGSQTTFMFNFVFCCVSSAADWKLDEPAWSGRMKITAKGKMAFIKLEDRNTGQCAHNVNGHVIYVHHLYNSLSHLPASCSTHCFTHRLHMTLVTLWLKPLSTSGVVLHCHFHPPFFFLNFITCNTENNPKALICCECVVCRWAVCSSSSRSVSRMCSWSSYRLQQVLCDPDRRRQW